MVALIVLASTSSPSCTKFCIYGILMPGGEGTMCCPLFLTAEAEVLCCADEAVLCRGCDDKVHTANKLSLKHHRLFLLNHHSRSTPSSSSSSSSSSHLPLCDICQGRNGYIFCLEDRALVCRECDESIHVAGIKSHQRFLIAGVKVSLESSTPNCDQISNNNNKSSSTSQCSHEEAEMVEATSTAAPPVWPLDDILEIGIDIGLNDFDYYNDLSDMGSSRID